MNRRAIDIERTIKSVLTRHYRVIPVISCGRAARLTAAIHIPASSRADNLTRERDNSRDRAMSHDQVSTRRPITREVATLNPSVPIKRRH